MPVRAPWLCVPASRQVCRFCAYFLQMTLCDSATLEPAFRSTLRMELKRAAPGAALLNIESGYWISSKILNMGMYSATTIDPTMPPSTAIIRGSSIAVSDSVIAVTSES